jgi:hypothetical protein
MSEPIKDRRETDETEEGLGQLVVTGGDAAVDFDPTEEVFNLMAAPVVAAMEAGRLPPARLGEPIQKGLVGVSHYCPKQILKWSRVDGGTKVAIDEKRNDRPYQRGRYAAKMRQPV